MFYQFFPGVANPHEDAGKAPDRNVGGAGGNWTTGGNGFKKIIIAPQPVGDVTWAKASYDSIRGKIISDWKRDGEKFALKISIPANTTAEVFVPAKSADAVKQNPRATFLRMENKCAVFETANRH